ncbi:MAG: hypothetical protein MHM6MM_000048 [Cercozoa sp. M6MM]
MADYRLGTLLSAALGLPSRFFRPEIVDASGDLVEDARALADTTLLDGFALWRQTKQELPQELSSLILREWLGDSNELSLQKQLAQMLRAEALPLLLKKRKGAPVLQLALTDDDPVHAVADLVQNLGAGAKMVLRSDDAEEWHGEPLSENTAEYNEALFDALYNNMGAVSGVLHVADQVQHVYMRSLFLHDENDDSTRASGCFDILVRRSKSQNARRTPGRKRNVSKLMLHVEQVCLGQHATNFFLTHLCNPADEKSWRAVLCVLRLVIAVSTHVSTGATDAVSDDVADTTTATESDLRFKSRIGGELFNRAPDDAYGSFLLQTRCDELPGLPGVGRCLPVFGMLVFLSDEDEGTFVFDPVAVRSSRQQVETRYTNERQEEQEEANEEDEEEDEACPLLELKQESLMPRPLRLAYAVEGTSDMSQLQALLRCVDDQTFFLLRQALHRDARQSGEEPFMSIGGYSLAANSPEVVPLLDSLLAEIRETDNDVFELCIGEAGCLSAVVSLKSLFENGSACLTLDDAR